MTDKLREFWLSSEEIAALAKLLEPDRRRPEVLERFYQKLAAIAQYDQKPTRGNQS